MQRLAATSLAALLVAGTLPSPGLASSAHPQMVTRIIARFEGYAGRYVWHCHILEHEDNEMMRPYEVLPVAPASPAS